MSPPYEGADVVLPHASLLAWFWNSRDIADEDEESKCDTDYARHLIEIASFHKRQSIAKDAATFCCFWCAVSIVIFGSFGICFVIDLALSHYGMGTGAAQWVVNRHQLPSRTSYGMEFCLDRPKRDAPGPQTWHYMVPGTNDQCPTDTIAFVVDPSEAWKIHPDDYLTLGYDVTRKDRHVRAQRPLAAEENVRA